MPCKHISTLMDKNSTATVKTLCLGSMSLDSSLLLLQQIQWNYLIFLKWNWSSGSSNGH